MKVRRVGSDEVIDLPEGHTMSMGYLTVPTEINKERKWGFFSQQAFNLFGGCYYTTIDGLKVVTTLIHHNPNGWDEYKWSDTVCVGEIIPSSFSFMNESDLPYYYDHYEDDLLDDYLYEEDDFYDEGQ